MAVPTYEEMVREMYDYIAYNRTADMKRNAKLKKELDTVFSQYIRWSYASSYIFINSYSFKNALA